MMQLIIIWLLQLMQIGISILVEIANDYWDHTYKF